MRALATLEDKSACYRRLLWGSQEYSQTTGRNYAINANIYIYILDVIYTRVCTQICYLII
ncbi:MAG: hypothetical protein ACKPKO_27385 [Candidatus Fonsibacter sp.]